jgi:hypothetical protein
LKRRYGCAAYNDTEHSVQRDSEPASAEPRQSMVDDD